MKIYKSLFVMVSVLIIIVLILGLLGCAPKELEVYKIGAILPLTGSAAGIGEYAKNGINIAISKINLNGGIAGKNIEVVYGDSKNEPKEGISVFNKFVSVDKLPVIISIMSSVSATLVPFADENEVVLATTIVSAPGITDRSKWVFRDFISSDKETGKMKDLIITQLGMKEVAVFYINDEFGIGAYEVFKEQYETEGGKIIWADSFEKTAIDFRSQIVNLKNVKPKGVYVMGYDKVLALVIKQIRELGVESEIFSFSGLSVPIVLQQAGDAAEGVYLTSTLYSTEKPLFLQTENFVNEYKSKFSAVPSHYAAYTYDLTMLIVEALKNKEYTADGIRQGLLQIKDFPAVIGKISILPNGEVDFPVVVKVVHKSEIIDLKNFNSK